MGGKGRRKEDFSFLLSNDSFSRHANFSWRDTLLLTYRFGWHGARSFLASNRGGDREKETPRGGKTKKEKKKKEKNMKTRFCQ